MQHRERFGFILKPERETGDSPKEIQINEFTLGNKLSELLIGVAIPLECEDAKKPLDLGALTTHLNRDEVRRLRDKLTEFLELPAPDWY